ncbi:hypothetical protein CMUST_03990 [Corynebacterium mustelae]|uniref:Uncharacterized protein n=1 Tax=Corynebacterium mustelae TaxID=571915 RepID=A0A0G3H251_9CORY|nr:hypothetical protein CMUST_03990 [Corynebacterium mustelae]
MLVRLTTTTALTNEFGGQVKSEPINEPYHEIIMFSNRLINPKWVGRSFSGNSSFL